MKQLLCANPPVCESVEKNRKPLPYGRGSVTSRAREQAASFALAALMLAAVPAQATPVVSAPHLMAVEFGPNVHTVTVEDTPEWAKLPNARAWNYFVSGIKLGGFDGIWLVLRAQVAESGSAVTGLRGVGWQLLGWPRVDPDGGPTPAPDPSSTPEPSTLLLTATAGAMLVARSYAKSKACWRR